jgi:hypothetical protein
MRSASWISLSVAICFTFGYAEASREARAALPVPMACPNFECKTLTYSWWGGDEVSGYYAPGGAAIEVSGIVDIFTPTSAYKKPNAQQNNKKDHYTYAACVPQCGKDNNGVWQAIQEVSPAGNRSATGKDGGFIFRCTDAGGVGPTNANPPNKNELKNNPPGYEEPKKDPAPPE